MKPKIDLNQGQLRRRVMSLTAAMLIYYAFDPFTFTLNLLLIGIILTDFTHCS